MGLIIVKREWQSASSVALVCVEGGCYGARAMWVRQLQCHMGSTVGAERTNCRFRTFRGNLWIEANRVAACCLFCLSFRGLLTKESKQGYLFEVIISFRCDLIWAFLCDTFLVYFPSGKQACGVTWSVFALESYDFHDCVWTLLKSFRTIYVLGAFASRLLTCVFAFMRTSSAKMNLSELKTVLSESYREKWDILCPMYLSVSAVFEIIANISVLTFLNSTGFWRMNIVVRPSHIATRKTRLFWLGCSRLGSELCVSVVPYGNLLRVYLRVLCLLTMNFVRNALFCTFFANTNCFGRTNEQK
jgi:hypothetical protein